MIVFDLEFLVLHLERVARNHACRYPRGSLVRAFTVKRRNNGNDPSCGLTLVLAEDTAIQFEVHGRVFLVFGSKSPSSSSAY